MKREEIITGFVQLGKLMNALGEDKTWDGFNIGVTEGEYQQLTTVINRQISYNGWFTSKNVRQSLLAMSGWLTENNLNEWVSQYEFSTTPKRVMIVMAGNIPLVGFHDFLCTLLSGHTAVCKLSSDDKTLLPMLAKHLVEFLPQLKDRIEFVAGPVKNLDAVIATGSDNSIKYFEEYFGKYPHIFRKNRTSVAILNGNETPEQMIALGKDVFSYFGLGCRNVSHLLLPKGFDTNRIFEGFFPYSDVINNNKYGNNYDYNKTVYLMNQHQLLDNNVVLLRETNELFSPLGMVHYQYYDDEAVIQSFLDQHNNDIQVIIGEGFVEYGKAQEPSLTDYADGVDVMEWMVGL